MCGAIPAHANKIFKLIPGDVRRPLSDISSDLDYADISSITAEKTKYGSVELQSLQKSRTYTLPHVEDNPVNLLLVEHIISDYPSLQLLSEHDGSLGVALARAHLPAVILIHQSARHERDRSHEYPAQRPGHGGYPCHCCQFQCHAARYRAGAGGWIFRYITKPINVNLLMNALDDALKSLKIEQLDTNVCQISYRTRKIR
jgi:CheY-like chemotaxis protein